MPLSFVRHFPTVFATTAKESYIRKEQSGKGGKGGKKERKEGKGKQKRGKKEEQQATADIKTITYMIQRGDTLTSICQKQYGTISRINEICQLNGISPEDIIYAGGKLLLPES